MLYIIDVYSQSRPIYVMYESNTNSALEGTEEYVMDLVQKYNMKLVNGLIENNKLKMKEWPNKLARYVLLKRTDNGGFRLIEKGGGIIRTKEYHLKQLINQGEVANCTTKQTENGIEYLSMDTLDKREDKAFRQHIDKKHNEYIAKCRMLGLDTDIVYTVEGREVVLHNYKSSSDDVVIPSFITAISEATFSYRGITSIKLNHGLKYIGASAFQGNKLTDVEIPETVVSFFENTFSYNAGLIDNQTGTFDLTKLKVQSEKTLMIPVTD